MAAFFIADDEAAFCVLEQNGVPSAESIERWREWAIIQYKKDREEGRKESSDQSDSRMDFINRIFDYAKLGRDKHADIRAMAQNELSAMLKSIARQVATKGHGRNVKGTMAIPGKGE